MQNRVSILMKQNKKRIFFKGSLQLNDESGIISILDNKPSGIMILQQSPDDQGHITDLEFLSPKKGNIILFVLHDK